MLEHQKVGFFINQNKDRFILHILNQINSNRDNCFLGFENSDFRELLEYVQQDIGKLFVAIISERPSIFSKYIKWHKSVALSRAIPQSIISNYFTIFKNSILENSPMEYHNLLKYYLDEGEKALNENLEIAETYIRKDSKTYLQEITYLNYVLKKQRYEAIDYILNEIENGLSLEDVYLGVIQNVQYEVGRLWQLNKITVADEHFATETSKIIMNKILDKYQPKEKNNKVLCAFSLGAELHEIGIRLVNDYFSINGWKTIYLGASTTVQSAINFICSNFENINIVAISGTMSSEIYLIKRLIELIRETNCRDLKIIVGGSVFNSNPDLVEYVGADGFGSNPKEGLLIANELTK